VTFENFGPNFALTHGMNNREDFSVDEKQWRKLCELVAAEPDPERLSQLVDQLLRELDSRRKALCEGEKASSSTEADI
jgi:hypothetical protein